MLSKPNLEDLMTEIGQEVTNAIEKYPGFNTAHEGYAVLLEEVDELWDEVKVKQGKRDIGKMKREAVQVAAMALRFAYDLCYAEESAQR